MTEQLEKAKQIYELTQYRDNIQNLYDSGRLTGVISRKKVKKVVAILNSELHELEDYSYEKPKVKTLKRAGS